MLACHLMLGKLFNDLLRQRAYALIAGIHDQVRDLTV
jgi:hypothetical protein